MSQCPPLLRSVFDAVVAAARPERWLAPALADLPGIGGRNRVLSLGKAAVPMAAAARDVLGDVETLAIAVGAAGGAPGVRVLRGGHPVPDAGSLAAGEAALAFAAEAGPGDRLLVLVSGGASAAACAPIPGVGLDDKAALTRTLLASGADIAALNTVRRALSRLKGGGLARACAGETLTLAMSDVPDDALHDIGSGPGAPSPTGVDEALSVLAQHAPAFLRLEPAMRAWAAGAGPTPDAAGRVLFRIADGLAAAEQVLRAAGWPVLNLGAVSGDVAEAARAHAALAEAGGRRAILSGGELSARVEPGAGRGGRNQAYALSLALALGGRRDVALLAADTDGQDGSHPVAGAWLDGELLAGLDRAAARAALDACDSGGFLHRLDRLLETGPTGVNVGDLRVILVGAGATA